MYRMMTCATTRLVKIARATVARYVSTCSSKCAYIRDNMGLTLFFEYDAKGSRPAVLGGIPQSVLFDRLEELGVARFLKELFQFFSVNFIGIVLVEGNSRVDPGLTLFVAQVGDGASGILDFCAD